MKIGELSGLPNAAIHNMIGARFAGDYRRRRQNREACIGVHSARQVRDSCGAPMSILRVQQVLEEAARLEYRKMKAAPALVPRHKLNPVAWAQEQVHFIDRG